MPTLAELVADARRQLRRGSRVLSKATERASSKEFGWEWEREYLGSHLAAEPSQFHKELIADLSTFHLNRGQRRVYRGPRGSGKTAHISNAYPLWCICENAERFVLLLAETGDQAKVYLSEIKTELESNEDLAKGYPNAVGVGPVWRDSKIVTRNGVCVVARGTAGRVLGLKHNGTRPTLVIGDDLNQRGDAYSPTMRSRKIDWFLKDVLKVGTPQTNFLTAGTSIHREAIVCELSRNPAWTTRRYKSITSWPKNMDLWSRWESLFANLGDENRAATAWEFYQSNRVEMEAGSAVLWPARYSLYDLMKDRAESGPGPFASERQDEEGTDGSTEWPSSYFDRPDLWFFDWPDELMAKSFFLDPSKGRQDKPGDYQAHVWGGWSKQHNCLFVEADLRREPGPEMVQRAIDHARRFGAGTVTVEGNSDGVGLLYPMFKELCERGGKMVGYDAIHHTEPKLSRIRGLTPWLARGQIRVRSTPGGKMMVDQLRDVPSGQHDDGPDALTSLVRLIQGRLR